jgi:hypothetical protein
MEMDGVPPATTSTRRPTGNAPGCVQHPAVGQPVGSVGDRRKDDPILDRAIQPHAGRHRPELALNLGFEGIRTLRLGALSHLALSASARVDKQDRYRPIVERILAADRAPTGCTRV